MQNIDTLSFLILISGVDHLLGFYVSIWILYLVLPIQRTDQLKDIITGLEYNSWVT